MTPLRFTGKSWSSSVRTHPTVGRAERRFCTWRATCCWEASGWAACLLLPGWTASVKKANPLTDKLINILRSSRLKGKTSKKVAAETVKDVWVNRTNLPYLLLKHRLSLLETHYFRLKKYSMSALCCTINREAWCDSLPTCWLINESVPRLRWCLKARLRSKAAVPHWAKGQRPFRTKG